MKYRDFATQKFIGLKSLQKSYIRANFTFRELESTPIQAIYTELYYLKEIIRYIQTDYWSDSKFLFIIFSKSEGLISFIKFLNSAASSSSFWVSVETTPEAKTFSVT